MTPVLPRHVEAAKEFLKLDFCVCKGSEPCVAHAQFAHLIADAEARGREILLHCRNTATATSNLAEENLKVQRLTHERDALAGQVVRLREALERVNGLDCENVRCLSNRPCAIHGVTERVLAAEDAT